MNLDQAQLVEFRFNSTIAWLYFCSDISFFPILISFFTYSLGVFYHLTNFFYFNEEIEGLVTRIFFHNKLTIFGMAVLHRLVDVCSMTLYIIVSFHLRYSPYCDTQRLNLIKIYQVKASSAI